MELPLTVPTCLQDTRIFFKPKTSEKCNDFDAKLYKCIILERNYG